MVKIATHNSATGEKGNGFLSLLITPFAKCQSKTIKEQYEAGCRMFDIRFKEDSYGILKCKHGIWTSKRTFRSILSEINDFPESCYVSLTYEGKNNDYDGLKNTYTALKALYSNIEFQYLAVKYGKNSTATKVSYDIIEHTTSVSCKQGFLPLDGRSWHTYLPIPWLWKKIYNDNPKFDENSYTYVDFL